MKSIRSKALNSLDNINKWMDSNNISYHGKRKLDDTDILKIYYEWIAYGDVYRYDRTPNNAYIIVISNYNNIKTIKRFLESKYYIVIY